MSVDKSLKLHSGLQRARSVLTRAERIGELREGGRWEEGRSVFGLPKVRVRRVRRRPKTPKVEAPEAALGAPEAAGSESGGPKTEAEKK